MRDKLSRSNVPTPKAMKVQAREVLPGDIIVPTRTSPVGHGNPGVIRVERPEEGICRFVFLTNGSFADYRRKQEVYVYRPEPVTVEA